MTIEELKAYLEANPDSQAAKAFSQAEDLDGFVEQIKEPLTLGAVKQFLIDDEDGRKWLQGETDRKVSKAIETFKSESMPEIIEEKVKQANPDETPEQKELRELKEKFEKAEADRTREARTNRVLKQLNEKQLPTDVVDLLITDDDEKTNKNLELFEQVLGKAVDAGVRTRLKENGSDPPKGDEGDEYSGKNPFKKDSFNLTEQAKLLKENPELAAKLKAATGK